MMRNVADLTDHCFVLASAAFAEIAGAMEDELDRKPTLAELCEVLSWGFKSAGDQLLSDLDPGRIERVTCKLRPAKVQRLEPGDVVAVPGPEGKFFLGVYITRNRFGHAFGFFRGLWPCRPLPGDAKVERCGLPIYTGLHGLWDGTWRLVENRRDLLSYFDADPEIYHSKADNRTNSSIGEFGAAERASNDLRQIDAKEAAEVGLLDGSYDVAYTSEEVPAVLAKRNR